MGAHLIDGEFQSDKYPTTPRGKVPLSVKDKSAQDLLWEYAQRRRAVDAEFADDLEAALKAVGYTPGRSLLDEVGRLRDEAKELNQLFDLQYTRTRRATALWQEAHNKPDVLPDLGELIGWLLERAAIETRQGKAE
jgi:hypothetical protein